jgi:hypothetical protein
MNYSLEMLTTVAECDALLHLAGEDKETLERRRRNLDESIGNFGERTHDYSTEMQSVVTLLETYTLAYDALPEGKNKMTIYLEMKRLEARKAAAGQECGQLQRELADRETGGLEPARQPGARGQRLHHGPTDATHGPGRRHLAGKRVA